MNETTRKTRLHSPFAMFLPSALALALASLASGCGEADPQRLLAESRYLHEVRLETWVEMAAHEPDGGTQEAEEAAAVSEGEADAETPADETAGGEAILSLFVASGNSPLELPCLTVDIVFTGGGDEELSRLVRELDVARIGESGGSVVVDLRVPLPDGEVSGIFVETHDPGEGGLDRLCEAAAISGGNGGA